MKQKEIISSVIIGIVGLLLITTVGFGCYLVNKNNQNQEKNQQHLSQNNNSEENLEILLQNYCTSCAQEYENENLELGDYYYFNFSEPNDAIVGFCRNNYSPDKNNRILFILKNNNSELEEIFKYKDFDLGKYSMEVFDHDYNFDMVKYPFIDIKILDINNDNKNELVFYSQDFGGSNSGFTNMIYLLYPQTKKLYYLFRHISSGPNEEIQVKNFYSNNLDSTQNKKDKDFLTTLMDEWFVTIYGDKYSFFNKITNEEAKEYFHATEIVNNNLPESIEFWTEAYCPSSGTYYDYNSDILSNYIVDKCEQGETGSHGGCKSCIMSKLLLHKKLQNENQEFVSGTIAKIQEQDLDIPSEEIRKMVEQIFKETECVVSKNSVSLLNISKGKSYNFTIKEVISSSFSAPQKNEKLFVLRGNGEHYRDNSIVFALFNENLNLLSSYEKDEYSCISPDLHSHYMNTGYFYCENTQTSYVVGINGSCPNGGVCGEYNPKLLQFQKGKFVEAQNIFNTPINDDYLFSINKNSISVYKWHFNLGKDFECSMPSCIEEHKNWDGNTDAALFLKELFFNNKTCKFE